MLTFRYLNPLFQKGSKTQIELSDIHATSDEFSSSKLGAQMKRYSVKLSFRFLVKGFMSELFKKIIPGKAILCIAIDIIEHFNQNLF